MSMTIDDIVWHQPVTLLPDPVREGAADARPIEGLISTGQVRVFDAEELAGAAAAQLEPEVRLMQKHFTFWRVTIPLSIRRGAKQRIDFLELGVEWRAERRTAVTWSLDPLKVDQEIKVKTTGKVTAGLKLEALKVGGETANSAEYVQWAPRVQAFGIGEASSGWEFRPVKGNELGGISLLHAIVQVKRDTSCLGVVKIRADIDEIGWLRSYRARKSDDTEVVDAFRVGTA